MHVLFNEDINHTWDLKLQDYRTQVKKIIIPVDLNPAIARSIISKISNILEGLLYDYHDLKSIVSTIDSTINNIEKKNLLGKNTEERKRTSVQACENLLLDDGSTINLYDIRGSYYILLSRIEAIKDTLISQQSLLVSMNGFMKLEERLSP